MVAGYRESTGLLAPVDATPRVGRKTRLRRLRFVPAAPIAVLVVFATMAIFAPLLTPYSPTKQNLGTALIPPAWTARGTTAHLLGTDGFGIDVFTRLLYGARVSMSIGLFSMLIAVVIGTLIGVAAGFLGGAIDSVLMRLTDVMLALPKLLVGLVIAIVIGPSYGNLIIVLGVLTWPRIARLVRGDTLAVRQTEYVRYSMAIGVLRARICANHVFPNILSTLLVATTLEVGSVILTEASLSFLGAGIPSPQPSWGTMIADGQGMMATGWWISLFPGLCIGAVVISCNTLGDWLRDKYDPRTRDA
jgi:ABC-type dipeptide/oligopeptide/nickel transport system permease subunit